MLDEDPLYTTVSRSSKKGPTATASAGVDAATDGEVGANVDGLAVGLAVGVGSGSAVGVGSGSAVGSPGAAVGPAQEREDWEAGYAPGAVYFAAGRGDRQEVGRLLDEDLLPLKEGRSRRASRGGERSGGRAWNENSS